MRITSQEQATIEHLRLLRKEARLSFDILKALEKDLAHSRKTARTNILPFSKEFFLKQIEINHHKDTKEALIRIVNSIWS